MTTQKKVGIVAGAVGVVGKYIVLELDANPEWDIIALSRRPLDFASRAVHRSVDLLSVDDITNKLSSSELQSVTHIFFAAYQEKPTQKELVDANLAMLRNLVEGVEKHARNLQHVSLVEGTKWYGIHLGPGKTPFKEDDPRYMLPNFYYNQQDYLDSRVKAGAQWTWSATRPNPVCGIAFGNPMNLVTGIAVYASLCKEMGIAFRFPGTPASWTSLLDATDSALLAKGIVWAGTTPECKNQAFNISNGDMMADKEELWNSMQQKYSLRKIPYNDLVPWKFLDFMFSRDYDWFLDVNKARRYGFQAMTLDTTDMFLQHFQQMRDEKLIP